LKEAIDEGGYEDSLVYWCVVNALLIHKAQAHYLKNVNIFLLEFKIYINNLLLPSFAKITRSCFYDPETITVIRVGEPSDGLLT
jgi:hypothetical protein